MEDFTMPSEEAPNLRQFNWVTNWLSKNNLNRTLDVLLDEYSQMLDGISLSKVSRVESTPPLSELNQTLQVHTSSVLTVRFHPQKPWIVSTDSSKHLIVSSLETGLALATEKPFLGAIISLDLNPINPNLLIIGTMDENHGLIEIKEDGERIYFETHKKWHCHSKYVLRTKWAPKGDIFATASSDKSIIFWKLDDSKKNATQLKTLNFSNNVEAIEFTKDSKVCIAAIRENAYLQYIHLDTWEISLANVNELGDDYVSFSVLELKLSLDGSELLASTDMSRSILFRQGTEAQLKNFYGFECDGYGQPRTTFDNQGFVYLTSQDWKVYVYDSKSGAHVMTLPPHGNLVRDLDYHPGSDLLASGSYDKTIKIWKRPA